MLTAVKGALALGGALVLAWDAWAARRVGAADRFAGLRDWLITAIGVLGFSAWWNAGVLHPSRYVHVHEFFHYYVGAKYEPELGHTWLYTCAAVATAETPVGAEALPPWIRDLETNEVVSQSQILSRGDECRARFLPARWRQFAADMDWFRRRMAPTQWRKIFADHGFNATPVWTMTGTLIANLVPASSRSLGLLALIDPALLLGMWGMVVWAFGWRTACVAALWWGTNVPARGAWVGGAFLRADWLALAVAGVCLLRRNSPLAGGFALAYSALLRAFPGCLLLGVVLRELAGMWRRRSWSPSAEGLRCGLGAVLAVTLLVPAASLVLRGHPLDFEPWRAFAQNSRKHLSNASENRMGLKILVSFDPADRAQVLKDLWIESPGDAWTMARARVFARRQPFYWVLVAGLLVLLVRAVAGTPLWLAAVLGTSFMVALELACYYYAIFLVFAFAGTSRRNLEGAWLALASAATVAVSLVISGNDVQFVAMSAVTALYAVCILGLGRPIVTASDLSESSVHAEPGPHKP